MTNMDLQLFSLLNYDQDESDLRHIEESNIYGQRAKHSTLQFIDRTPILKQNLVAETDLNIWNYNCIFVTLANTHWLK